MGPCTSTIYKIMTVTGYISICKFWQEFSNWSTIYSLGYSFAGACVNCLLHCPHVINKFRWEFPPKMVGVYSPTLIPWLAWTSYGLTRELLKESTQ